jgi:hypothetical protein
LLHDRSEHARSSDDRRAPRRLRCSDSDQRRQPPVPPQTSVSIPVDFDTAASRFTGYAVANSGAGDTSIALAAYDESGRIVETLYPAALNPLGPGKQAARFLHQDLTSRARFKGSLVLTAQGEKQFAAVALVQSQELFTAIPVLARAAGDKGIANLQALDIVDEPSVVTAAVDAGAMGIRPTPNISWHGIEPVLGGPYRWTNQDEAHKNVQAAGLEHFRVVSSARPEYNPFPGQYDDRSYLLPQTAPDTGMNLWDQYKKFVRAVVRRYYRTAADGNPDAMPGLTRGIRRWSYTPEIGTFWVPISDPVQRANDYVKMFEMTSEAIHEVDPSAQLFLPFNGAPYLAAFVDGFLARDTIDYKGQTKLTKSQVQSQYGGSVTFVKTLVQKLRPDVYDFHLYGDAESIPGQKAWLLSYLASQGSPEKPIYSMEGGEPYADLGESFAQGPTACPAGGSVGENAARLAFQSAAMVRHFALALSSGYESVTFNMSSEYAFSGAFFGDLDLVDVCSKPRPAYYTFKLCRDKLIPYRTASELSGAPANVRLFRFTFAAPKGNVWIAWDTTLAPGSVAAHNLSGFVSGTNVKVTHAITAAGQKTASVTTEAAASVSFGATPVLIEAP